ncbi:UDP-N-acetylmuramoyl-tripeptide--D-alanyl-D-alanine ligase [Schaalia cardiffensis]|uniref:UDP-N-acetylmuramoyl-tripeptide--D-alanyl-D- alanine ligase n=1 Tax=Schaalia cardiffensis TaxID=181487 RepID=UPI0023F021DB|nr:UDP-N-acetylmuramoyl-tripeptide--D-alanyl-D-alanine ligase [Schaalia cardiffensis]
MERSAGWIAQAVTGTLHGPDRMVTGPVVTDSREAQEGSCYVARRGEMSDGHDYAQAAVERGAVGVIVERILDLDPRIAQILVPESTKALGDFASAHLRDLRANQSLDVIAVTGSAGKTTTKDLLFQILSADAPTIAPKLSFNNEVGLPLTVLSADHTTRHMVLEMGASGPGHIAYLTEIVAPDVAVELMVGHAHLGGFGSVEGIAKAKAELIVGSVPGAPVILNADDERVMAMAPLASGPVWTFSASGKPEAQVRALNVTRDAFDRARFTLLTPEGRGEVALGVAGVHHVNNALAAISGALVLGIGFDKVLAAVNGATALSPHRMDVVDLEIEGVPFTLIDDAYNANLDSMRAGFAALAAIGQNRPRFAVLSEMLELGEESAELHRAVGDMARDGGVTTLVVLGGDSHFYLEGAGDKVEGVLAGSVEEAAALLCAKLEPGCVVLVKGSYGSQSWKVADLLREKGVQR